MIKDIIIIGNPIAGGGALKKIRQAVSILENKGFNVNLMLTTQKGDAELFARQASQQSAECSRLLVIAAGGDGTYNEVANGLIHSNIPMAILPLGTTSVLAKELNISNDIKISLDIALNGKIQTIHLGKITCKGSNEKSNSSQNNLPLVTRHFLLMAGIGFDGETVYSVNPYIKKIAGKTAYVLSGIKNIFKYNPSIITLRYDSEEKSGYNVIIGKASCYGGDFKVTPDARLTDPYFYVFVMHQKGKLNLIRYILGIVRTKHLKLNDISYFRTSEIEIEGNAHIQIDGDYLGTTPAKIDLVTDAIKIITPK
ncbi:hypothetical protein JZK55_14070 [Dissulfurispira thermophila]|uniref:DAGKc domain-containing protein n=2 Tax=root TaxID=1 RepID=A0A7G1H105_9BACT|nr:diacylglycerol kinase family protein [Dissulfurispira thermophila]BCB96485.1 hypothetical protein JZK55_14070 [Dissulfurispira thermophila]